MAPMSWTLRPKWLKRSRGGRCAAPRAVDVDVLMCASQVEELSECQGLCDAATSSRQPLASSSESPHPVKSEAPYVGPPGARLVTMRKTCTMMAAPIYASQP